MTSSKNSKSNFKIKSISDVEIGPAIEAPFVYERSITFELDPKGRNSGVEIKATEVDGTIVFEISTLDNTGPRADIQGLFFNLDSNLAGNELAFSGEDVTTSAFDAVRDLGKGANVNGLGSYDAGVRFGTPGKSRDVIADTVFTLSNATGDLTLDVISHMDFGVRVNGASGIPSKFGVTAPAAPDAIADSYTIFEDNAVDLDSPTHIPSGAQFDLLENDSDADGDVLTIVDVRGATHGSVTIIDGDDADDLIGDAVLYTPDADYSGPDSFEYLIDDGDGGRDFASVTVDVVAVADVPELSVEVEAGATVNQIVLTVTATQSDADSSEFMDRILASGDFPEGAILTPGAVTSTGQPDQITQEFTLTLPEDRDANFDLSFTATSQETSNGDQENAVITVPISYEYNEITASMQFTATDQSIWSTGDQFTFTDDRFIGLDTGAFEYSTGSTLYASASGDIRVGFESSLSFEGGQIDASADYDVNIETHFNHTTDQLQFDTSAILAGGSFVTEGPTGDYKLDFVYDILFNASAGVNIDLGSIDLGFDTLEFGSINRSVSLPEINFDGSINLIDLGSEDLAGEITFPDPVSYLSLELDWPEITTAGTALPNPATASGESENFLQLTLDLDELAATVAGLPVNPLNPPRANVGPAYIEFDLLDVDVFGGMNFIQDFELGYGDLKGMLVFENGASQLFTIGESLLIDNASLIDLDFANGGDGNGIVDFEFIIAPTADLSNDTQLGFNIGVDISVFEVEVGYDVSINNPFSPLGEDSYGFSDSETIGPLTGFDATLPLGSVSVFDDTFALNFDETVLTAFA